MLRTKVAYRAKMPSKMARHPRRSKVSASNGPLDLKAFFDKIQSSDSGAQAFIDNQSLVRLRDRQRFVKETLASLKKFTDYVDAHHSSELIRKRIDRVLKFHKQDLDRLAKENAINEIAAKQALDKYRRLAEANYVDPGLLFPEIPEILQLTDLKSLVDRNVGQANLPLIEKEWSAAFNYLSNRWRAISGRPFPSEGIPPLSELLYLLAPVPLDPAWSFELHSAEAVRLGHEPLLSVAESKSIFNRNRGGTNGSALKGSTVAASATSTSLNVASGDHETGTASDGSSTGSGICPSMEGPGGCCSIDRIYGLAGANKLKPPNAAPNENTAYTFPGRQPLGQGENIFYDYAIMIPVTEYGPFSPEIPSIDRWNAVAADVLITSGKGLLNYLRQDNLSKALGFYLIPGNPPTQVAVIDKLDSVLDSVLTFIAPFLQPQAPPAMPLPQWWSNVRTLRRLLRQMAALARSLSRQRLVQASIAGTDPAQYLSNLNAALNNFPAFFQSDRFMATADGTGPNPVVSPTLAFGNQSGQFPSDATPRPLGNPARGPWVDHYQYDRGDEYNQIAPYLQYLGGQFFTQLTGLKTAAQALANAVQSFQQGQRTDVLAAFARLAEGVIHDALFALATLYDDLCELLPMEPQTNGEGTKRLAMMVTFRQTWYPGGYAMGKLVGYKNLLPNQKELLKRRTFVKTTRELTTAEEFAASREEDYSRSSKETSELLKEGSTQFNLTTNASGHFDLGIGFGFSVGTSTTIQSMSRETQNRVAEATMKSAAKYSEKREVKIKQLTEIEDVQEVISEVANLNREITANYFYYQLLRQYSVTMEFHGMRPVLLRTREVPSQDRIDYKFLADYAYILVKALPGQLSVDMQETVSEIESLMRNMIRKRADLDQRRADYESFRQSPAPQDAQGATRWQAQAESVERLLAAAQDAFHSAEGNYLSAQSRLDRVISHIRENVIYYMQFIWQAVPKVDQDYLLQQEKYHGIPLPELTLGLSRLGYFGKEEVFEFSGLSVALLNQLLANLVPGSELASLPASELSAMPVYQQLRHYYATDSDTLVDQIRNHAFIKDPAEPEDVFGTIQIQVAQDALVIETLPGQVPLLEGFQMAHRMLDVQKVCLENAHLGERIKDRPWQRQGDDSYRVYRRDGDVAVGEKTVDVSVSAPATVLPTVSPSIPSAPPTPVAQ